MGGSTTFQPPSSATGLETATSGAAAPAALWPAKVTVTEAPPPRGKAPGLTAP